MATKIRNELSTKNMCYIEKHRYLELKHFCLQYNIWKKARSAINSLVNNDYGNIIKVKNNATSVVEKAVLQRDYYNERMEMVENCAKITDEKLSRYLLYAVTNDITYDKLKMKTNIPCSRTEYYKIYRLFFKNLNKMHY